MGVMGTHVMLGHDQVRETVRLPGTRTSADRTRVHGEPTGATQAPTVSQAIVAGVAGHAACSGHTDAHRLVADDSLKAGIPGKG